MAWLRAQAGLAFGGYHYHQEPTVLRGPIVDAPITFGGSETPAAQAAGFTIKSAMEIPSLQDNLGVRASYRSVLYKVDLPDLGFEETISDWLNNFQVLASDVRPSRWVTSSSSRVFGWDWPGTTS